VTPNTLALKMMELHQLWYLKGVASSQHHNETATFELPDDRDEERHMG
jgi:hypothetical protein